MTRRDEMTPILNYYHITPKKKKLMAICKRYEKYGKM